MQGLPRWPSYQCLEISIGVWCSGNMIGSNPIVPSSNLGAPAMHVMLNGRAAGRNPASREFNSLRMHEGKSPGSRGLSQR